MNTVLYIIDHQNETNLTSTYSDFEIENNNKDPKFEVGDHVRISKYKTIFSKGYTLNWSVVVVKHT